MANELVVFTVPDMEKIAKAFSDSKLFGMETPAQAMALCLIAQAEGLHPAIAARDYHIIKGKPTLKADAMLSRFQNSGGKVEYHEYTDTKVEATFTHPQGGTVRVAWDMVRAKQAELGGNGMWKKYPRQMLRSRVISEGIRTVFPGANSGFYTDEEVVDMVDVTPKKTAVFDTTRLRTKFYNNVLEDYRQAETPEALKTVHERHKPLIDKLGASEDDNDKLVFEEIKKHFTACQEELRAARLLKQADDGNFDEVASDELSDVPQFIKEQVA